MKMHYDFNAQAFVPEVPTEAFEGPRHKPDPQHYSYSRIIGIIIGMIAITIGVLISIPILLCVVGGLIAESTNSMLLGMLVFIILQIMVFVSAIKAIKGLIKNG